MTDLGNIENRAVYLMKSGKVKVYYGEKEEVRSVGSYFGENLVKSGIDVNEQINLVFEEDSVCGVLPATKLRKMVFRMSTRKLKYSNIKVSYNSHALNV